MTPTNVLIAYRVLIVHKNTVGGEIWCSFLSTHAFLLGNWQTYATRSVPYYRVSRIFTSRNFTSRIVSVPTADTFLTYSYLYYTTLKDLVNRHGMQSVTFNWAEPLVKIWPTDVRCLSLPWRPMSSYATLLILPEHFTTNCTGRKRLKSFTQKRKKINYKV